MRYVEARVEQENREKAYRFFVTESLRMIPQNKWIAKSYDEVLKPRKIDRRTGDEIAASVMKAAGLRFGD